MNGLSIYKIQQCFKTKFITTIFGNNKINTFLRFYLVLHLITWTVKAVNFLELIIENGYSINTYFSYSILNIFGIITKFIPLSFLITLISIYT